MENEKQICLQLSISQLEILKAGLDCALIFGSLYHTQKRKAENLHVRLIKILNENKRVNE